MTATNKVRARRFAKALHQYQLAEHSLTDCLVDILADARHWCDSHGLSYAEHDDVAYGHYATELSEEVSA